MKKRSRLVKKKHKGLKRHHKIILMSTFGIFAFTVPFLGVKLFEPNATSSGAIRPKPPVHIYQLSCSSCPGRMLCLNTTSKIAYCYNSSIKGQQGLDTTCVTCGQPVLSVTPPPGCYYANGICPEVACKEGNCPPCPKRLICPRGTPVPVGTSGGTAGGTTEAGPPPCIFDSDCQPGSVCNPMGNSCRCTQGTGHGTCTLGTSNAGGSTGGTTGPAGTTAGSQ